MKRFLLLLLVAVTPAISFAQGGQKKDKNKYFERIQSEKIAFFTSELDLTPEEAQVFWPVYNQYSKDLWKAHRNTMKLFVEMEKGDESMTAKEREAKVDAYVNALGQENNVLSDYHPKFKKVLPVEKVCKLYAAEEAFRMKMIHGLKKGQQPPRKKPASKGEGN